jgi:multidrug efflux pump subunit AcrB
MPKFSISHPYFIIVICLFVCVLGLTSLFQMPVDMFPPIEIPVVLVATFYNGMPPRQIEADITDTFERFFTLGSGIDHIQSRSMGGVSLITVYFQPGTNADADVTQMSNLAMADLRRLPQGTLPPVVLSTGASSLPAHRRRQGHERDAASRLSSISNPQPDRRSSGRHRAASLRREVSPGDGLR